MAWSNWRASSGQTGARSEFAPPAHARPASLAAAAALVVAIWLAAAARWLWLDKTVPWDAKNQFYAFFRFLAQSFHDGTSVFWNPYHFGGHPSIADPQSLIFSPAFVIWAWFDSTPSMATFDLIVYAHLLAGGLAIAVLGWRRDWPVAASVLAAAVFMLGGAASGRLNHTGIITCYGLFPVALLAFEAALERKSLTLSATFALLAATIALGRNQVALLLCLVLVALAVVAVLAAPQPWRYLRERRRVLAVMLGVGLAVIVVPLLLTLQFAIMSNRPAVTLAVALEASLHPSVLMSMAVPNVFGSHNMGFEYWGPNYTIMPDVAATDDSFNYLFFGMVPMALLGAGAAAGRIVASGARTWAAVLAVALVFSLGRYTPLFALAFEHLPGVAFFRRPIDGMFVAGIAIAMLSGHLLAEFMRHGLGGMQRLAAAAVTLAGLVTLASALDVAALTRHTADSAREIAQAFPVAAVVAALLWWAHSPRQRALAGAAMALVAVSELMVWNVASRLNAEPTAVYRALGQAPAVDRAPLDLLLGELERRHREGARPRVEIVEMGGAWQNLAVVRAIEATNGYNPLRIGLYDRMIAPGEASAAERRFTKSFSGYDCALARALGVEYLVAGRPIEQIRQLSQPHRWQVLMAGPEVWIYRFTGAMPRVKFHANIEIADADAISIDGALRHPPDGEHAVIDDETPPRNPAWVRSFVLGQGQARIADWRPGRVEVEVEAPATGVLVLHDIYYPGWVATVDGAPAPILRADTIFRGVEVAAGRHRVTFEFAPLRLANLVDAVRLVASSDAR